MVAGAFTGLKFYGAGDECVTLQQGLVTLTVEGHGSKVKVMA